MQNITPESVKELISNIISKLIPIYSNIDQAQNIAWQILQFVTKYTKAQLLVNSQINISELQLQKIEEILKLHVKKHKPIQYIFEHTTFLDLDIKLNPGILIPRPETENWCNELINDLRQVKLNDKAEASLTILDLCTGTGCIGLSLAKAFPKSTVYAVDISADACKLAKINAEQNNIKNVVIIKSDLYKKIPKAKFDLIVSNPPYISYKKWKHLDPMVKKWENPNALTTKNSGTFLIKKIIKQASQWLKSNSLLKHSDIPQIIIETDNDQAKKVGKLLKHYGFDNIIVKKDMANMDRVIQASLKGSKSK